jgi:uncharacterized protein (DUF302 family)
MPSSPSVRTYEATQVEETLEVSHADFTRAFEGLLGKMNFEALSALPTLSAEAARTKLASFVGPLDFTLFQKIDHGAVLTALTGRQARAVTYVFGNALIAVEMTRHDARAGLYVPLRLFVQEIAEGRVRVTYDRPSSLLAPFGSPDIDAVARGLDAKVERLLREAAPGTR